jgi:hypothetical protein
MAASHEIRLREARDRVIDLLGIGETYPLTDLEVPAERLTTTYGGTARIVVRDAQPGVSYQLRSPKGEPAGEPKEGKGEELELPSPRVIEDVTYRIRATKTLPSGAKLERDLDQVAPVRVGIDTEKPAVRLEPEIVNFRESADVVVTGSQEGVDYSLIVGDKPVAGTVTGNRDAIRLPTGPMTADATVRVRATKVFAPSENRKTETGDLLSSARLRVRADPRRTLEVSPAVLIYGVDGALRLSGTEQNVEYRGYSRTIADEEFMRGAGRLQVRLPAPEDGQALRDYQQFAAVAGGGEVELPLKAPAEDVLVVVEARKTHGGYEDPTSVWLKAIAVVLVQPDAQRRLTLRVPLNGARTADRVQFSGGQEGVYYYLLTADEAKPRPAYFHKQGKGLGRLAIGIDFAVASAASPADPKTGAPMPIVAIQPLAADGKTAIAVRAVKAQTGIPVDMARKVLIHPVPEMRTQQGGVLVVKSDAQEFYQLELDGKPSGNALAGTGADLTLPGAVEAAKRIEVVVTRASQEDMRVERVVRI